MYLLYFENCIFTARKTIFPKSSNIMKNSTTQRKYQLSTNFLDKEKALFPISVIQNKNFSLLKKHGIPCWKKYHLASTFWIKRRPYSSSPKSSKQKSSIFRKHGISCRKKYHLTSTFLVKRRPYFPSPKSSKQELSHNMNFSFRAKFMVF